MSYYGNTNQTVFLYRRLKAGTAWKTDLLSRIDEVRSLVAAIGNILQQNAVDAQAITASTSTGGLFDNLTAHIRQNIDNLVRNISLVDSAVHEYLAMGDGDKTDQLTANVFGLLLGSANVMLDQCVALSQVIGLNLTLGQPVTDTLQQLIALLGSLGAAITSEQQALKAIVSDLSAATDAVTLPSLYQNSSVGKTVLDAISQTGTKTILMANEDQGNESDKMSAPGVPDQVFTSPTPIAPRPINPLPALK